MIKLKLLKLNLGLKHKHSSHYFEGTGRNLNAAEEQKLGQKWSLCCSISSFGVIIVSNYRQSRCGFIKYITIRCGNNTWINKWWSVTRGTPIEGQHRVSRLYGARHTWSESWIPRESPFLQLVEAQSLLPALFQASPSHWIQLDLINIQALL